MGLSVKNLLTISAPEYWTPLAKSSPAWEIVNLPPDTFTGRRDGIRDLQRAIYAVNCKKFCIGALAAQLQTLAVHRAQELRELEDETHRDVCGWGTF